MPDDDDYGYDEYDYPGYIPGTHYQRVEDAYEPGTYPVIGDDTPWGKNKPNTNWESKRNQQDESDGCGLTLTFIFIIFIITVSLIHYL